jgi:hypothetical protein
VLSRPLSQPIIESNDDASKARHEAVRPVTILHPRPA